MNGLYGLMMGQPDMLRRRNIPGNQRFMPMGHTPMAYPGGYDSSGINPHNMYGGSFGQPQFPQNPGGFHPMSLAGLFRQYA